MRITSEYFEDETYWCRECNKDINEEEVNKTTWECDDCNNKILIDIGIENGQRLVRLPPAELTRYDDVYDQYYQRFHSLKGITFENGKYRFGVAEYGMVKVDEDEFVNCRWRGQGLTF
ncbi:TPA: hypothetical protein QC153_004083 [Bacillus cereus]|jgi:DNA-directed RNA polymerase subunit RPC12/RpoP|uniref:Uncharacterized protein n=1 Tax=Bacillus mobilis TaxID=2026190 RepID=A0A1Y5YW72_9BACI|nr:MULTISPECIES: hypothetical protein [Bacillus cereus group]KYQ04429.1 hypothetical protein B4079_0358 [Bacillus cereus]MBL3741839.1 hypothetical protein [Bacillus cereus]MBL3853321.1 hypothetical protein [Bacillus cereus]MBL3864889.1 hypothetical protein [Bacillus cereus]SMD68669.1 hypothetical protein BACERE00185_00321 [Bacillus mobilis]